MYCKVTYPILSYAAVQQQCQRLDQFIINLQTLTPSAEAEAGATSLGAPDAQLPGQSQLNRSQPAQPSQHQPQLIPLATVLDSAQGDASWFASPRNAQLMLGSSQPNCELPRRELELGETGSPLLYRAAGCNRARRCCCTCTKLCAHRCLHDCFVRLWLWKRELDSLGVATSPAQLSQPSEQGGSARLVPAEVHTSQLNARC